MKGVQYLVNDKGKAQAVVIDLKKNRRLGEDVQDILVSRARRNEPRESLEKVESRLRKLGKL